jgi:hypothetical protein
MWLGVFLFLFENINSCYLVSVTYFSLTYKKNIEFMGVSVSEHEHLLRCLPRKCIIINLLMNYVNRNLDVFSAALKMYYFIIYPAFNQASVPPNSDIYQTIKFESLKLCDVIFCLGKHQWKNICI